MNKCSLSTKVFINIEILHKTWLGTYNNSWRSNNNKNSGGDQKLIRRAGYQLFCKHILHRNTTSKVWKTLMHCIHAHIRNKTIVYGFKKCLIQSYKDGFKTKIYKTLYSIFFIFKSPFPFRKWLLFEIIYTYKAVWLFFNQTMIMKYA